MFCHIPMNDVWEVQQVIELVAEMAETTDNASQVRAQINHDVYGIRNLIGFDLAPWNPLVSIKEEMSWLAYTLLQLQHLTLQSQLQEVGLLALDEEMPDIQQHLSAESFPGKSVSAIAGFQGLPPRMLLVTAPNHLLEHRAEANGRLVAVMYCGGGEGHLGGQMLSADGSASNESSAYNQSSATARLPSEVLEQIHAGLEAVCQALPRDMWPEEWHQATEALEPGMDGSVPNVAVQLDRDAIRWVRTTKPGDAHNDQLSELRSRLTRLGVVPTTFIAHESTSQESYPYDAATPARHHTAPATMPLMSSELRDPLERSWDQDKWNASSIQRSGQSSLKMSPSLELSQTYGKCKSLLNSREQTLPEDDSDHDEDVEEEQRGTLEEIQMDTVIDDSQ
eukprot:gene28621-35499_t